MVYKQVLKPFTCVNILYIMFITTENKNNQIRITMTKMSNLKIVNPTKISNFTAVRQK